MHPGASLLAKLGPDTFELSAGAGHRRHHELRLFTQKKLTASRSGGYPR